MAPVQGLVVGRPALWLVNSADRGLGGVGSPIRRCGTLSHPGRLDVGPGKLFEGLAVRPPSLGVADEESMVCPRMEDCDMFRLFNLQATMGVWKTLYCLDVFERCERFQLKARGEVVPQNLLPNGSILDFAT